MWRRSLSCSLHDCSRTSSSTARGYSALETRVPPISMGMAVCMLCVHESYSQRVGSFSFVTRDYLNPNHLSVSQSSLKFQNRNSHKKRSFFLHHTSSLKWFWIRLFVLSLNLSASFYIYVNSDNALKTVQILACVVPIFYMLWLISLGFYHTFRAD